MMAVTPKLIQRFCLHCKDSDAPKSCKKTIVVVVIAVVIVLVVILIDVDFDGDGFLDCVAAMETTQAVRRKLTPRKTIDPSPWRLTSRLLNGSPHR